MRLKAALLVMLATPLAGMAQSNKCSNMTQFKSPGIALEITRAALILFQCSS